MAQFNFFVFPFEQLGQILRRLSLSGGAGNAAAFVLYIGISLLPVLYLLRARHKRKLYAEDVLTVVLSLVLFGVLYLMVNPGLMAAVLGQGFSGMAQAVGMSFFGGMVYSVLFGYVILRFLRMSVLAENDRLGGYLQGLLYVLVVLLTAAMLFQCLGGFLSSMEELQAGNTGGKSGLGASFVFLGLRYLVQGLSYGWDILVVFGGIRLLRELKNGFYCTGAVMAAQKLCRRCTCALSVMVLAGIAYNLLQLVFARALRDVRGAVQLPVLSVVLVLAVLLLARLIQEGKTMKDDNDMFI